MEKLKEWLHLTAQSPEDLAHMIGASPNSVRNWLSGRNAPGGIMLRKLHDKTHIPLEDLVPKDDAA